MKYRVWYLLLILFALVLLLSMNGPSNTFAQTTYQLTIDVTPIDTGFTDPPPGDHSFAEGAQVSLSAIDNLFWIFDEWTGPDAAECATGLVAMDADKSCTANFVAKYGLFTSEDPPEGGSVSKVPDAESYAAGTPVTLSAEPNPNRKFDGWIGQDAAECETGSVVMNDHKICIAVFSWDLPIQADDHWMADIDESIKDRRLLDVVLPGSHDSGTFSINHNSGWASLVDKEDWQWVQDLDAPIDNLDRRIASLWARTQSRTFKQQLDSGICYFDVRFLYNDADMKFYVHHTLIGPESEIVFNDIATFLNNPDHKKEIIILDLTHWKNMDETRHKEFTGRIYALFGDKMISRHDWDLPLGEIWAKDKQLIVIYENLTTSWLPSAAIEEFFWLDRYSPWPNVTQEDDLRDSLADNLNCGCGYTGCDEFCTNENMLFVTQGILTPDDSVTICGGVRLVGDWLFDNPICDVPIVGSLTCGPIKEAINSFCSDWENAPRSVRDLADKVTPMVTNKMAEWWKDCKYCARDNMNIIMVDFFEVSNLIDEVRKINQGFYNHKPSILAGINLEGDKEGSPVQLTAAFNDIDPCDHHSASIDWGDGTAIEEAMIVDTQSTISGTHVFADNATYTVTLYLQDGPKPVETENGVYSYHYSLVEEFVSIKVENVAPTVVAGPNVIIDEAGTFTLETTEFNDKGTLDTHTATINWDDRLPPITSTVEVGVVSENPFGPPGSTSGADGTVAGSSFIYGDNGIYNVEVCVTDDDGGVGCDQVEVTVNNIDPTVDFDKSAALSFAGGSAFLARRGIEQTFKSDAADIGSDDLIFTWTFPPSALGSLMTYFNDGSNPDPVHSPHGVFTFYISDTNKTTFDVPGVYEATIGVSDDDGGTVFDSLPLLMTDSRGCTAVSSTWRHQFGVGGKQTIDDLRLQGYLDLIRFASTYFDDGNLVDLADAAAIFRENGRNEDHKLKQHALAAWLNFASGGVLWDQEIPHLERPFHEVIGEIDAVLLNPNASTKENVEAQQDAIRISTSRPNNSSCNDAGTP